MDLQKNKKRAQRRARNYVAKHMHEHKRGGPMSDKRRQRLEELEEQWVRDAVLHGVEEADKRMKENDTDGE